MTAIIFYLVMAGLAGALAGTLLLAAGYEGWCKVSVLAQGAAFVVVSSLLVSSMPYFKMPVIVSRAHRSQAGGRAESFAAGQIGVTAC